MTKIEMLETRPVSVDGLRVETWAKGTRHIVSDDLLRGLIQSGAVVLVEDKAIDAAPENKAAPVKRKQRKPKHG